MDKCNGRLPLHIAADFGQLEVMKYLINEGANVNVRASSPVRLLVVTLMGNLSYFSSNDLGSVKIWLRVFLNSIRDFFNSAFFAPSLSEVHFPKNFSLLVY